MIMLKGFTEVSGVKVPNIEGGFGEDRRYMLVKHIAELHGKQVRDINRLIKENSDWFVEDVDYIDIKGKSFDVVLNHNQILSQSELNRLTNIYIISERGYIKLIKLFTDKKSKEVLDVIIDDYFFKRQELRKIKSQKEMIAKINEQMEWKEIIAYLHTDLYRHRIDPYDCDKKVAETYRMMLEGVDSNIAKREILSYRKHIR